ncbi:MAG: AIR synthase-related protein, partial [Chromatiaceae bacterium]
AALADLQAMTGISDDIDVGLMRSNLRRHARHFGDPATLLDARIHLVVAAACELLGLDPLYVANEGKLVAICPADEARTLLDTMRGHPLGIDSAIIGRVVEDHPHFVQMETSFGGQRIVGWLAGEQLPRIC